MPNPVVLHIATGNANANDTEIKDVVALKEKVPRARKVCIWCAHTYNTPTVNLDFISEKAVTGSLSAFCTYECAAAYNEYCTEFHHDKNQGYARLCLEYNKAIGEEYKVLKLAPSRLSLALFGGPISITRYRKNLTCICVNPTTPISYEEFVTTPHKSSLEMHSAADISELQNIIKSVDILARLDTADDSGN